MPIFSDALFTKMPPVDELLCDAVLSVIVELRMVAVAPVLTKRPPAKPEEFPEKVLLAINNVPPSTLNPPPKFVELPLKVELVIR